MIFSVCKDHIEWCPEFGPDSVTLTAQELVLEKTTIFEKNLLAVWSLLLSPRKHILNKHIARFPLTPNQEVTMEMRDEALLRGGAQDMDNNGYQVSELDIIEFYWEMISWILTWSLDRALIALFHPERLMTWSWEVQSKNLILLNEEEDKENSPPKTPVS